MTTPPPPAGPPTPPDALHRRTNAMAVVSLVCAFLFAPLSILFGHLSRRQIRRTGEAGRGLALAGLIIGYTVTVLVVAAFVGGLTFIVVKTRGLNSGPQNEYAGLTENRKPPVYYYLLPTFDPPSPPGADCQYPATTQRAGKPVNPPRSGRVPTDPEEIGASIVTTAGNIGLRLDNAKSPCTVNSFVSLAQQGFFDDTTCHRLITSKIVGVLGYGDPTGTGAGGPGYHFANEYPTNQYPPTDPVVTTPTMMYPRGTLAMANTGPDTNGSQFFMVYRDSVLPASYTVFGTVDDTGLATLDKIAAAGVLNGGADGRTAQPVTIRSVRLN